MADARDHKAVTSGPLENFDQWDDFVHARYPDPDQESPSGKVFRATDPNKKPEEFCDYRKEARSCVKEFYRLNHKYQTLDFVLKKKETYLPKKKRKMGIWEAMELLNTLVDDSDPDTDLPQIEHAMQASETIRKDGHPDWFILTGLIHDLGKVLCLYGEPQWAVVGDTFPVGCAFSQKIVFPEFFGDNPDSQNPKYQTSTGIYSEGCGLDNVHFSWGHDEYLYHVVKDYLPDEALHMIRYHSFYPCHRENEYTYLMSDRDKEMFQWVHRFIRYDLYSKSKDRPNVKQLRPYYEDLIAAYFPPRLDW